MLSPNSFGSKFKFLELNRKLEQATLHWLMGFFVFAAVSVLLSEHLSNFLRQYSFQLFLMLALVVLAFRGWLPLVKPNSKSMILILILGGGYFLGLFILDWVAKLLGHEAVASPWLWRKDIILLAVLAPILEELFFRDLVFRMLYSRVHQLWLSILFCSLFFMTAHLTLYPGAFLLGVINCLFVAYTKSLWPGILFHSISNMSLIFIPAWFPSFWKLLEDSGLVQQLYR